MSGRLENKVAIVTGAGTAGPGWGNGKATAVLFARHGASVLCVDREAAAARETAELIGEEGGDALAQAADVTRADQVASLVSACLERWGRIDVLHNNVGILEPGGPVETSEESWERVLSVNLKSMFLTCRQVLPVMEKARHGVILNVGSIAGIRWLGVPYISYAASKAAVIQFTKAIALQYAAKGIRANVILPGLMNTPMAEQSLGGAYGAGDARTLREMRDRQVPMGHMGEAWDVAYAALFLASDEAKYITAAELVVDGGLTARAT